MSARRPEYPYRRSSSYSYDEAYPYDDRPRLNRQPSRSAQILGAIENRDFRGAIDAFSKRSRSADTRRPRPRTRRYDSYSSYDTDSDSDGDYGRSRGRYGRETGRRSSSRRSTSTRSLGRRDSERADVLTQAAKAAFAAGAAEAWKVRNQRGRWTEKGTRVATAAAGAAAIAAFKENKADEGHAKHKRNTIQATIGGLLLNKIANGRMDNGLRRR